MNANAKLLLTLVAALTAATTLNAQPLPASPRAREQFPELTRSRQSKPDLTEAVLKQIKSNTAFAQSPRVREQFPSLDRVAVAQNTPRPVISNRAFAASPRAKEQFPWLAREPVTFEIAPVK